MPACSILAAGEAVMRPEMIIRCMVIALAAIGGAIRLALAMPISDDAGPVQHRMTACLIAEHSHTGPKCEIPPLPDNAPAAELASCSSVTSSGFGMRLRRWMKR